MFCVTFWNITGLTCYFIDVLDCNLDDIDLDSDFDPESHDRRMQQVFDNDFYGKTDPDGKPVWDDDIEIDEILPDTAPVQEEINFEPGGDAYDPLAPGGKKLSKKMKRLAKAEKKRGVVQNMEPEKEEGPDHTEEVDDLEGLSPEERKRKLLEAMDEYHKLDCEDMVCRNRYSILTLRLMTDTINLYECSKQDWRHADQVPLHEDGGYVLRFLS
ncbi:hypothetical protein PGT21_019739 [Puccinia graminis f. sp. tritici]|uniref:Uncharacterized protein n=1 Tax=Puccinia graminis f. sp. tritici TaxID=56615 RepID=A0A5B0RHC3_PUCGR|nr:hypothetical protein PGT21_019739 [Puccinia graminis f. sp. tritici]KAA1124164.1 hypothetical protein PGTUg99_030785 [Puccinia graminis f. sp. tritici]